MPMVMPEGITAKTKLRIPMIVAGLKEQKTTEQIAKEIGVSTRMINNNMKTPMFLQLRDESIQKDLTSLYGHLDEFYGSEDPEDRRTALRVHSSMIKALLPKHVYNQNENLNVDLKIEGRIEFRKMLSTLTPEMQDAIIKKMESLPIEEQGFSDPTTLSPEPSQIILEESQYNVEDDDEEDEDGEDSEIS